MLIGYMRVSKTDGSQSTNLQCDALIAAGVSPAHLYEDRASGRRDDRPGLADCLKALREGDTLIAWKLDRLGRDLRYLINTVHDLTARNVGLKVLAGNGAAIDATTAAGKLVFGIFAALAEFERELISERTVAGLVSARARGRKGGRPFKITASKLRLAMAAMGQSETIVGDLCAELGVTRQTLSRHVSPKGELRLDGLKLISRDDLAWRRMAHCGKKNEIQRKYHLNWLGLTRNIFILISKGRFTEEFKIETVKQVEEHGRPLAETVARQGVSTHSTHTWLKRYNKSGEQRQQDNVEAAEIKCLKTEATQLREERDA